MVEFLDNTTQYANHHQLVYPFHWRLLIFQLSPSIPSWLKVGLVVRERLIPGPIFLYKSIDRARSEKRPVHVVVALSNL